MKFLSKIEAKTSYEKYGNGQVKRLAEKCKKTRWKHFSYNDIKLFPSIAKYYEKALSDFTSGKINIDEFSSKVGYEASEIVEVVFDQAGYDLFKSLMSEK